MPFSINTPTKKHRVIALLLLAVMAAVPILSVQASVSLLYFRAVPSTSFIMLEWETAQELDNFGFNVYRGLTSEFEDALKLNPSLIPSQSNGPTGAFYQWQDNNVQTGTTYTYWLEDIDVNGNDHLHDPITASPGGGSTIPTVPSPGGGSGSPTPTRTPTRTLTPTTESGTSAPSTPTRTPTRAATAVPNSSNPTATTAPQLQPTSPSNNPAPVTVPQNTAAAPTTGDSEEPEPTITIDDSATSEPTTETIEIDISATPQALAQAEAEGDEAADTSDFQQIGQGGEAEQADETADPAAQNGPNRSTLMTMALIGSVVLLFVGGGGIIALVLNRTKKPRI